MRSYAQRPRQSSASADARRSRRLFSRSTSHQPAAANSASLHATMTLPPPTRRRFLSRSSSSRPPRRVFRRLSQRRTPSPSRAPHPPAHLIFEPHTSDVSDSASNDANQPPSHPDLVFIDDVPHIKFCNVGEEEEPLIPDASTPYCPTPAASLPNDSALHNLTAQNDRLAQENHALQRHNAALHAELDSVRTKSAALSAELATLTQEHNDARSKLSRRIRLLEAQLNAVNCASSSRPRAPNPPAPDPHSHPSSSRAFARVQSLGSVSESSRRRSVRASAMAPPQAASLRRALEDDTHVASPASRARQGLIRRAFVAHIHAHRYRTARQAWVQFLGAERQQVTLNTFSTCVRNLAVASEATDRELQLLMQEICEVPVGHATAMTWNMFIRFYNSTKSAST